MGFFFFFGRTLGVNETFPSPHLNPQKLSYLQVGPLAKLTYKLDWTMHKDNIPIHVILLRLSISLTRKLIYCERPLRIVKKETKMTISLWSLLKHVPTNETQDSV